MHPAPVSAFQQWPQDLLREHGIVVRRGLITVRGRDHEVAIGSTVEAESHEPRALPSLAMMCFGVAALPFTHAARDAWVVGLPIAAIMFSGLRLLTADSRFRVVLHARQRRSTLFESNDEQLVIALTAAVRVALEDA